jgi:putative tryptophan/tyrosine transport system substrate-binding protein
MRRREFVALAGGAAVIWPLATRAQQPDRIRRIGVLMAFDENDPEPKSWLSGFVKALAELGWTDGRNLSMNVRWAAGNADRMRMFAKELVDLKPDLILANSTTVTASLQRETQTIPIVFVAVSDPIGPGFVKSFERPGGNITGFTNFEETMGGKWLELLREIAPSVSRTSMLFNPETANAGASGGIYLTSIETAARNTGTELIVSAVHDPAGIDEVFAAMAQGSSGGVLVMPNNFTVAHQERIVAQAERRRVPTIYPYAQFVRAGGLLSYGVDNLDLFRRAASYTDRILKGANPVDLPVQQPVKFELVINRKTATALGLSVPSTLFVAADEVIE